jgi:hypothetical protein
MKRITSLLNKIVITALFAMFCTAVVSAQSNYVLKTGDTMTGTLNIDSQGNQYDYAPNIQLSGSSSQYKYLEMKNTSSGAVWDLTMDVDDQLTYYYSPDGSNTWHIPFAIDTAGIIYGNAFGLTNLNVALAIPTGSITADKLDVSSISGATILDNSIGNVDIASDAAISISKIDGLEQQLIDLQEAVDEEDLMVSDESAYSTSASITVQVTDNEVTNGQNLKDAYIAAIDLGPASSNRIAVIVPPGRYNLGTVGLQMNIPYIDLIGQTTDRAAQYLCGAPERNNGVIKQTSDYVRIENLTVENKSLLSPAWDYYDPAAYFPTVDGEHTVIRNCYFPSEESWICETFSMRLDQKYAGYYENVVAGYGGFGVGWVSSGDASGTFIDCVAGDESFGSFSVADGTFIRCSGGIVSFGGESGVRGTFVDCSSGYSSFGWGTFASSAILKNCSAGYRSFSQFAMASDNFSYNASGHFFAGGPISGDGSGLTGISAQQIDLSNIGVYGDISMGSFTNSSASN